MGTFLNNSHQQTECLLFFILLLLQSSYGREMFVVAKSQSQWFLTLQANGSPEIKMKRRYFRHCQAACDQTCANGCVAVSQFGVAVSQFGVFCCRFTSFH